MNGRLAVVLVVVVVVMQAAGSLGWGSSLCNIIHQDKEWISQLTAQSAQRVNATVAVLEQKLDAVLNFVEDMKTAELSWARPSHHTGSGTVERDLTGKEEPKADEEQAVNRRNEQRSDSAVVEEEEEEQEETPESETTAEEERERNEERRNNKKNSNDRNDNDESGVRKGECSALEMDDHETIGMFFMNTYNHGHCANRYPITHPIRYCYGYCATRTFIARKEGIWSQGNDCRSCQPERHENINIPLKCDDGFSFEKSFRNVVTCKCRPCRPIGSQ